MRMMFCCRGRYTVFLGRKSNTSFPKLEDWLRIFRGSHTRRRLHMRLQWVQSSNPPMAAQAGEG